VTPARLVTLVCLAKVCAPSSQDCCINILDSPVASGRALPSCLAPPRSPACCPWAVTPACHWLRSAATN